MLSEPRNPFQLIITEITLGSIQTQLVAGAATSNRTLLSVVFVLRVGAKSDCDKLQNAQNSIARGSVNRVLILHFLITAAVVLATHYVTMHNEAETTALITNSPM